MLFRSTQNGTLINVKLNEEFEEVTKNAVNSLIEEKKKPTNEINVVIQENDIYNENCKLFVSHNTKINVI